MCVFFYCGKSPKWGFATIEENELFFIFCSSICDLRFIFGGRPIITPICEKSKNPVLRPIKTVESHKITLNRRF